jgi:hypothetical protein
MIFYPKSQTHMRIGLVIVFILSFCGYFNHKTYAQSTFTGMVRNYNGIKLNDPDQWIIGRNVVRLNTSLEHKKGKVVASGDLLNSYLKEGERFEVILREAFVDLYFNSSELRVGKQIVSRGRANGVIMTDYLNPINLSEFLTQDLSDLRQGLWALKYQVDIGKHELEWIINPFKIRNNLPNIDGIWDIRNNGSLPASLNYIGENLQFDPYKSNVDLMLRLRPGLRSNIDLGISYWDYPMPAYQKKPGAGLSGFYFDLNETYTKSIVISGSADFQLADGVLLKTESLWFSNRSFDIKLPDPPPPVNGLNPEYILGLVQLYDQDHLWLRENRYSQNMIGLDYNPGSIFMAAQLFMDWLPKKPDDIAQRTTQTSASFLIQREWYDGDLTARLFARTGLNVNEFWVNPEVQWKPIDNVQIAVGTHCFSGTSKTDPYMFNLGVYKDNSFLFTRLTYSW